jgi:hypothetical protein
MNILPGYYMHKACTPGHSMARKSPNLFTFWMQYHLCTKNHKTNFKNMIICVQYIIAGCRPVQYVRHDRGKKPLTFKGSVQPDKNVINMESLDKPYCVA